ncbi:myb-like DNA-binding domain-containing protein [Colletotrichum truncatum]|uniref:Myb-like DNA-binding domain-containing protein n=1 Tax=Colletotrichum truncatum TaxID=5467 RepID=A0ACC3YJA0_COLTU|nr:myb-like DNA-binding domain-containing protein [Colletotrichum truncatum]KAF6797228.1 myb-like DNA-binding domain-containing protein [Colletotrichum truncatum]
MSSMFKKKGGMAFKPKMPQARPRAPGAASTQPPKAPSSTATETATQPEAPSVSNDKTTQKIVNTAGVEEPEATQSPNTPPSTSPNVGQAFTPQSQQPESSTVVKPTAQEDPTLKDTTHSGEFTGSPATSTQAPTTPVVETPPSTSTTQPNDTAPAQLQTPPATATDPSGTDALPSIETQADGIIAPTANKTTKAPAKRTKKRAPQPGDETEEGDGSAAPKPKRQRKKNDGATTEDGSEAQKRPARPRKKKAAEDGAVTDGAEDGATEMPRRESSRRARSVTPDDAENQEADLSVLTMGDLTRDLRIGKKFSRHDELLQRHRDKQLKARERLKNKRNGSEDVGSESGTPAPTTGSGQGTPVPVPMPKAKPASGGGGMGQSGPQFQIIDGQIVVDQNSLALDRHAIADAAAEDMLEIEENDFTTLTTQNSYRTGSKLKGPNVWTEEETELFYRGLRMFGTDFQMISGMFPGKNRRHVKMKFNREERHAPARIDAILVGKKELQIDLEEYKTWTKAEYEPVEAIMAAQRQQQAEFDAEQAKAKAAKDAINARKKAALEDPVDGAGGFEDGESSTGGGKNKPRPQASVGPQITVDADGMITIDETNMDPDAGRKKKGASKAKKKAVEYNMRGEIIR